MSSTYSCSYSASELPRVFGRHRRQGQLIESPRVTVQVAVRTKVCGAPGRKDAGWDRSPAGGARADTWSHSACVTTANAIQARFRSHRGPSHEMRILHLHFVGFVDRRVFHSALSANFVRTEGGLDICFMQVNNITKRIESMRETGIAFSCEMLKNTNNVNKFPVAETMKNPTVKSRGVSGRWHYIGEDPSPVFST